MSAADLERKVSELRQHPQTFRLWNRNLRTQSLLKRWQALQALAAGRAISPGLFALRVRQLSAAWVEIESFFARFEASREQVAKLAERRGLCEALVSHGERAAAFEHAARRLEHQWVAFVSEPIYSGDLSIFADLELGLTTLEDQWRELAAEKIAKTELPAAPDPNRLRASAEGLLADMDQLMTRLDLSREVLATVVEDKNRITDLLNDGEPACAFWWAKDLSLWLHRLAERNEQPEEAQNFGSADSKRKHARFQSMQKSLAKIIRKDSDRR